MNRCVAYCPSDRVEPGHIRVTVGGKGAFNDFYKKGMTIGELLTAIRDRVRRSKEVIVEKLDSATGKWAVISHQEEWPPEDQRRIR
jgi:hypothetical protein